MCACAVAESPRLIRRRKKPKRERSKKKRTAAALRERGKKIVFQDAGKERIRSLVQPPRSQRFYERESERRAVPALSDSKKVVSLRQIVSARFASLSLIYYIYTRHATLCCSLHVASYM